MVHRGSCGGGDNGMLFGTHMKILYCLVERSTTVLLTVLLTVHPLYP